jgi:spore maturation protein CgeB
VNAAFQEIFGNTDGWSSLIDRVVYDMYNIYNCKVFRQVLVDWVLDAGVTNVKLWGSGWQTEEKYKKYAMGPAKNGETLSKIYQASKIVLGNNVLTTAAARAWEAMQSGAFYMSNYIPEESDCVDIRKIIDVDKDVIMFYDRDDLIRKLHYYLEHEDERKKWRSADEKQL